jgi:predicted metalloprotease with PDZ domain
MIDATSPLISSRLLPWVLALGLISLILGPADLSEAADPIVYRIKVISPESHTTDVEVEVPTSGQESIELMMPVWSPGFYRVENYAAQLRDLTARTPLGDLLEVEKPKPNRWKIRPNGSTKIIVSYRLACEQRSVTTNWVGPGYAVWNGPATFVTLVEAARRPHLVRIVLPETWKRSMTALEPAPGGEPNSYMADDYDTLVDSPIVAGNPLVHEFDVEGSRHALVDIGDIGTWDGEKASRDLEKIARETRRFWGSLPFERMYLFLNVFRQGGGGLEHRNSTLLTSNPTNAPSPRGYSSWLSFVSHEYFHAINIKRLRPVELGPFDYENPPTTASLWISEGLTTYFGNLMVVRSGLMTPPEFLVLLSREIRQLQSSPGRLLQTLEQSSFDVWKSGTSGIGRDSTKTVSYYVKGPIVGFLLDARIRRASGGSRSLNDVMRLAYRRHAGDRGFTPEEFRKAAEEVAGSDLGDWFRKTLASTEELDYTEALDWFGLKFASSDDPAKRWNLEPLPDASEAQKSHFRSLVGTVDATGPR